MFDRDPTLGHQRFVGPQTDIHGSFHFTSNLEVIRKMPVKSGVWYIAPKRMNRAEVSKNSFAGSTAAMFVAQLAGLLLHAATRKLR